MSTRLDRLLVILDTGSTPVTRKAAAKQLGEVQKLHPHELPNLLNRVLVYLKSKNWDTRIAAAQAVEAVACNVPKWNPDGVKVKEEENNEDEEKVNDGKLKFEQFDILTVLERGEKLLGSAGDEFDMEEDSALEGLSHQDAVTRQRRLLRKKLGLDMVGGLDMGMDNLFEDEDLINNSNVETKLTTQLSGENAADVVASQIAAISSDGQMSSREKNRAKRKAKSYAKQRSKEQENRSFDGSENGQPAEKRKRRTQSVLVEQPSEDKVLVDNVVDNTLALDELDNWPFEDFCVELCNDLFNPAWELRHGSSSALREIIKLHGDSAGKSKETQVLKMREANTSWLEDTALKLLCVFALDRFGDFVSDEVVAPVHETCAQTLGTVLHHMTNESVLKVFSILIKLQEQNEWQVRHGGLLGLKYMLAVRKDMATELLPHTLPWILKGLQDGDDDVRAVAAAALLPVAEFLGTTFPNQVAVILTILWDILLDLDDLTASTNSVMCLLASLVSINLNMQHENTDSNMSELVPRLWPFFKHNITSVRMSSLKTLDIILSTSKSTSWLHSIIPEQMRQIYQRIVLEKVDGIREAACKVWAMTVRCSPPQQLEQAIYHHAPTWFRLVIYPANVPIDGTLLTYDNVAGPTKGTEKGEADEAGRSYYIASTDMEADTAVKDSNVLKSRISAARVFGILLTTLSSYSSSQPVVYILNAVETLLASSSAIQQMVGAMVVNEWAKASVNVTCPQNIIVKMQQVLMNQIMYEELLSLHQRLQMDTQALVLLFREQNIDISSSILPGSYNLDSASMIATTKFNEFFLKLQPKDLKAAESKQQSLLVTIGNMQSEFQKLYTRVQSSVAAALIALQQLPAKLNPVIRPIMDSVKKEEDSQMQKRTAVALAQLLMLCVNRSPCPNGKIIKNLCSFVCNDTNQTPPVRLDGLLSNSNSPVPTEDGMASSNNKSDVSTCGTSLGILTLHRKQKNAIQNLQTKRGRISRCNSSQAIKDASLTSSLFNQSETEENAKILRIQRHGAETALSSCADILGEHLPTALPSLWEAMFIMLKDKVMDHKLVKQHMVDQEEIKQLITSMQVLETTARSLNKTLKIKLVELLPNVITCLQYPFTCVRHMAARCLGTLSKIITTETMEIVLTKVVSILGQSDDIIGRQGAIEALVNVIDNLGIDILPYIVLLIVPVLGRMSDQVEDIRLMATSCFATLVQLMPLEAGIPDPPCMSKVLIEKKESERRFLEQLLDGTKLDQFAIPVPIKCDLRKYQQDGVNWLAFLKKYNLHGILCDDMGLGKTLQSICIMAADYHNTLKKYKISGKEEFRPLPSLVVCPPTLTGHWCYEVEKFCHKEHLKPLHYTGSPNDRQRLRECFSKYNLMVASYDIIRNDSDFFLSKHWNYCVLDEGHIIKNSKTKLSKVIRQLKANHRLILSGTPIQNNVLELWSLFDFLMPGFLGSEKEFITRFGKPILQSRDAKSSSKEQEAGALAMEALHKQTLPFLLRRVKEDVLQDLPPKIIQDYYCDLSPLQVKLYEDFSRSRAKKDIDSTVSVDEKRETKQQTGHIFQALQYLRKVCNHPSLVLTPSHPEYDVVTQNLRQSKTPLSDLQHSGKLMALKQLLLDCGIGVAECTTSEDTVNSVVSQHRALIFCQLKSMLNIVENDLLKSHMPSVTYSRLDGSVPAGSRHDIVQSFNNDPSIDVLLLTTHVGGLGLNLTGADTVIFVEHDWNPMKDLQAMDRAHRIGQKKVVNVYRLIARGTLEEKIMGLQKFKLNIANTVITQDNSSLHSMDTSQLLGLFTVDSGRDNEKKKAGTSKNSSMKAIMEDMEELWDDKQYDDEYNLDNFMGTLKQ